MKKILISSDPNGRFDLLLPKVNELNAKNKFDFMIITGSVCVSNSTLIFKDIMDSKLIIPLPIYFIDNSDMSYVLSVVHPNGFQIANNFHYLGNMGFKDIMGIKIAYFSGTARPNSQIPPDKSKTFKFSKMQAKKLVDQLSQKQIDILLTNQWPQQFSNLSNNSTSNHQIISQICYQLSPRYQIASGGSKYHRIPPFKGRKGNPTHFINVAEIKQQLPKDKYLIAIQLNPNIPQQLQNISDNPFLKSTDWNAVQPQQSSYRHHLQIKSAQSKKTIIQQKKLDKNSFIMFEGFPEQTPNDQIIQFMQKWGQIKQIQIFKKLKKNSKSGLLRFTKLQDAQICLKDTGKYTMYQNRIYFSIKHQNQKYTDKQCFLCFSNTIFDQRLLVTKANHCLVCLDKGPLIQNHFQIIPINHVPTISQLQQQQQQQITQFRNLTHNYFIKKGMTFVCIQRYMNLSSQINHAILHCIPLNMEQQVVLQKFKEINSISNLQFEDLEQPKKKHQTKQIPSPYYIIFQINNKKYIKHVDKKDKKFDLPRQILCQIIDKPEKLNWRNCQIQSHQITNSLNFVKQIFQ